MKRSLVILDCPLDLQQKDAEYDVVRLGPWAVATAEPSDLMAPEIQAYPTSDAVKQASSRSLNMAERLLDHLSGAIPRTLEMEHALPNRFWEIFLFPFLVQLAGIVEDLRVRCESLAYLGEGLCYGVPRNAAPEPPQDIQEYLSACRFATPLRIALMDRCVRTYLPYSGECALTYRQETATGDGNPPKSSKLHSVLGEMMYSALEALGRTNGVLWERYHLPWTDVFWFARNGVPFFNPGFSCRPMAPVQIDWKLRSELFSGLPAPYSDVLPIAFPAQALEGLGRTLQEGARLSERLHGRVKRLYTFGQLWLSPEAIRAAAGLLAAKGAEIVSVQHGGGYGIHDSSSRSYIDYRLSNTFVSWGWSDPEHAFTGKSQITPLPSLYLSHLVELSALRCRWEVLVLIFSENRYPKWLYSPIFPDMAADYFQRERLLFEGLKTAVPCAVKLHPKEFGWGQNDWIKRRYPEFEALSAGKFTHWARRARLCIVDCNSTGFLELLAMRRPFMASWNRRWFRGQPLFEQYLDGLEKAGIFYDRPEDLVKAYWSIRSDIESWWAEPERRHAVDAMAREFALSAVDCRDQWGRFIRAS